MFGQRLLVLMGNLECYFREFHAMSYLNHSVKTIIIFPVIALSMYHIVIIIIICSSFA